MFLMAVWNKGYGKFGTLFPPSDDTDQHECMEITKALWGLDYRTLGAVVS